MTEFSRRGTMLSLIFSNIVAIRKEITTNLIAITIEEDNIAFQLSLPEPNIHIIVVSINQIVSLKQRNANILAFLHQIDN